MGNFHLDEAVEQFKQQLKDEKITDVPLIRQLAEEIANSYFSLADFESTRKYQDAIEKARKGILRTAGYVQLV